jgi:hypothetical protein
MRRNNVPREFIPILVLLLLVLTCSSPANMPANASSIAELSPSSPPTGGATIPELDPTPTLQQPPVQQQTVPQNTQGVANNTSDTANTTDINLLSSSSYMDSIGSLHVIGELQNNSPDPREYVKIVSTLHDPSDSILDTSFTYSEVEVLRPGEKSPFDVIFSNEQQVQNTQRYEISSITGDVSQDKPANLQLNVGDSYYDSIGSAHVVGEVTNNGPGISHYTKVSGTFYDDQNKIVATGFTYTDPTDLEPVQSAPFDMIISDDTSANIASGSLNVQSSEYAMILPAAVFEMNGQSDGNSSGDTVSLGGGPIDGSPGGDDGGGDDGGGDDGGGDDGGGDDGGGDDGGDGTGEDSLFG